MRITINNNLFNIPSADQLTVNQYCDLVEGDQLSIVEYLAYFTGYTKKQILNSFIKNEHLDTLTKAIGHIKKIDDFLLIKKMPDELSFNGKQYDYNTLNSLTASVGARILLAQFQDKKDKRKLDSIIYLLAIITDGTLDAESTEKQFKNIQSANYIDAFKIATFFFLKLTNELSNGTNFLNRLKMKILIKIKTFGNQPGLIY